MLFFSSQHFKYFIPLHSTCKISAEKTAYYLIQLPLYMTSHFSLTTFKILSPLQLWTVWSQCVSVWISLVFSTHILFPSCTCILYLSPLVWNFSATISSSKVSAPFLLSFQDLHTQMWVYLMVSHTSLSFIHFSSFFFLFAPQTQWFQTIWIQFPEFFMLSVLVSCWTPLLIFSSWLLCLSSEFWFGLVKKIIYISWLIFSFG